MGYDISTDGGTTFTNMVECYVATENAGGEYYIDAARYPNHGIFNPIGNTDPNEAHVHFFAATLDASNSGEASGWGGYGYGWTKIGDPTDTTKNLSTSNPADEYFQYIPDAYTMTSLGEYWVPESSFDWTSGTGVYHDDSKILVNHGAWDPVEERFGREYFYLELEIVPEIYGPVFTKVEFSPDGQIGYIVLIGDDSEVEYPQSAMRGLYPILFRTEDAGETWSDPIAVTLSGDDGIEGVLNYLTDEELAVLYEPVPDREELVFVTDGDCDVSVDQDGNPQIAIFISVNLETNYSYYYGRIAPDGHSIGAPFLLSSTDRGEEGSWIGYNLGRTYNYTYDYDTDFGEQNRIQIARTPAGDKMFVSWADTDTTVSPDYNNAPDIWARGVNLNTQTMSQDNDGLELPNNVTFGSEATFQAYFFCMANEVFDDGAGNYT